MERTETEAAHDAIQAELLQPPPSAWTSEPPKADGWYFKGWQSVDRFVVVYVRDGGWRDMNGDQGSTDDCTSVRWQGPLEPRA